MKKQHVSPLVGLLLIAFGPLIYGQDRYISDELYVPLRSGMGIKYRITHRGLPSGSKLKLIEERTEEGWSLVETSKGDQGWIRNQYLKVEPVAKLKLKAADQRIKSLEEQRKSLQQKTDELQQQNSSLQSQLTELRKSSQQLGGELEQIKQISAGSIDLHAQHQALMKKHQLLQTKIDVLNAENERLRNDRTYQEWLYGAGILLLGIIATLVSQSMGKRKRYSEWG